MKTKLINEVKNEILRIGAELLALAERIKEQKIKEDKKTDITSITSVNHIFRDKELIRLEVKIDAITFDKVRIATGEDMACRILMGELQDIVDDHLKSK